MTEMKDDLLDWALIQGPSLGFKDIEDICQLIILVRFHLI